MPKRGSCGSVLPGCRLSKQYPSINSPAARCCTRARRDAHCTLLGSPVCRDTPRLVLASRSPSRAAPTCDPHSARCSAGCHTSRDFVPWRFLDAGQLSLRSVSSLPASKNQHRNRQSIDHCSEDGVRPHGLRTVTRARCEAHARGDRALADAVDLGDAGPRRRAADMHGAGTASSRSQTWSRSCRARRVAPTAAGVAVDIDLMGCAVDL